MDSGAAGTQRGYRGSSQGGYRRKQHIITAGEQQNGARYQGSPGKRYLKSGGGARLSSQVNGRTVVSEQDFNRLISRERLADLDKRAAAGVAYDGKGHSQYATLIKRYTSTCKRSLSREEQNRLMPMLQSFQPATHWSWRSLTTTVHSLTSAGLFTQFTSQKVRRTQASLLRALLETVLHKCTQRSGVSGLDATGIANLLWAMAKLVDNSGEMTTELKEAATALLPEVDALKEQLNPQGITNLLWAMAKLVDNGFALSAELQEAVATLLPRVTALKERFIAQGVANLLWALAKLVEKGQALTPELQEALAALLPQVVVLQEQFIAQHTANLLWATAKLVDNGYEQTPALQEVIVTLLSCVWTHKDQYLAQHITNLLWAMAKLVDNGQALTPEFKEAAVALLPPINACKEQFNAQGIANLMWAGAKLVEHCRELFSDFQQACTGLLPCVNRWQAHFNFREIPSLIWSVAKLVENGQTLTPALKETVATLLPRVHALKEQFTFQGITNLLWAGAKLVDNGQELTSEFNAFLATVLLRVKVLQNQFNPQGIANLLWAAAKLVDNGYERTPMLAETIATLLSGISTFKDQFIPQHIANLLWAVAKLVDNGQSLTAELKEVVATLLPGITALQGQFIPQHIANLLWAVAKLVDHRHELTTELQEALAALLPRVSALQDRFNFQEIASLLWAMGLLGDLVSTEATDSVAQAILGKANKLFLFSQQEVVMALWGLLICCARQYLDKDNSNKNAIFDCLINKLFSYLERELIDAEQSKSVMALAASWLGRQCPVEPHYLTENSTIQTVFCAQLQAALPSLKIVQEKSLHSLPPVDLFLPAHRIAIEIQGPLHYVGRDFHTRNGSTLLKIAVLQKAGYDVLEIPVNRLQSHVKTYINLIRQKTLDCLSKPDSETGQQSDKCLTNVV